MIFGCNLFIKNFPEIVFILKQRQIYSAAVSSSNTFVTLYVL